MLTERSFDAPAAPDRVSEARRRARRQQARHAGSAIVAAGLVVLAGVATASWLHHDSATQPARPASSGSSTPTPSQSSRPDTVEQTALVDGLQITTVGPAVVPGVPAGRPWSVFPVSVRITNPTAQRWKGEIGVGLYGQDDVSRAAGLRTGYFHGLDHGFLYPPGQTVPRPKDGFVLLLAGRHRIEGVVSPTVVSLGPGETRIITIRLVRITYGYPHVQLHGWIPVLNPRDAGTARFPDPASYPRVH
jgi:hypothetical protein